MLATPQLSVGVAAKLTPAEHWPASLGFGLMVGQTINGFSLSLTMTRKLQDAVLPAASVAVQRTVVVPLGKAEPEAGLQTTVTPGVSSVAVTV